MIIVGQYGYQTTPKCHQSSLPVLSGISDHVITDYDVIIRDLRQNCIQSTKKAENRFRGVERAKLGQKGIKIFRSFAKTGFLFHF